VSVFLTTQYLEEADRLADHIGVLDAGRVVASGTAAELKHRIAEQRLDLTLSDRAGYDDVAGSLGERVVHHDLVLGVPTDGSAAHLRAVLDEADPTRRVIRAVAVHTATLDDVFLALTGLPATTPTLEAANASPAVDEPELEPANV
jgi:ABC-2 type transport system ATP-binding protein